MTSKSKHPVGPAPRCQGPAQGHTATCVGSNLQGLDDVRAHEGLLAFLSGLEGVLLPGLPLLALGLLESALQPLHPLMHPHIGLAPTLPAPIG